MTSRSARSNAAAPRAVVVALGLAVSMPNAGCESPSEPPDHTCPADAFLCGRPRNLAHRGGGLLRPENTLLAFSNSAAIADVLELDVQRTADGTVVVMHDFTVDRTTDGVGKVNTLTFAALEQLDAGYQFTLDDGATYPYRGMGVRVPTLEQVLDAFPAAQFSIEIKDSVPTVSPVLAMIAARGLGSQVVIASFDDNILAEVRSSAPDLLTTMSLGEMVEFSNLTDADEASYLLPAPIAQAPTEQITDAMLARAQRQHLVIQAWTVDDEPTMIDLLARGVDGIITNDPERLRAVIAGQ